MAKKHILDVEEGLWKKVLMYKIQHDMKNNNEACVELIENGLKKSAF